MWYVALALTVFLRWLLSDVAWPAAAKLPPRWKFENWKWAATQGKKTEVLTRWYPKCQNAALLARRAANCEPGRARVGLHLDKSTLIVCAMLAQVDIGIYLFSKNSLLNLTRLYPSTVLTKPLALAAWVAALRRLPLRGSRAMQRVARYHRDNNILDTWMMDGT